MTEQPAYPPPYGPSAGWPAAQPSKSTGRLGAGLLGALIGGVIGMVIGGVATFTILMLLPGGGTYETLGEDPRIDELYDMCGDGNMAACDLLYYESAPGSPLEDFANTCGDRVANADSDYCTDINPESDSGTLNLSA